MMKGSVRAVGPLHNGVRGGSHVIKEEGRGAGDGKYPNAGV